MKGICLAFFSLSTSEQEEVVVVVVVVGGGGGAGGFVGYLSTPLHALQVSFATTSVASLPACVCFFFVCLFFLGGGGAGAGCGCGCRGWWGERRQLNLPGVFTIRRRLHTSVNMRT